MNMNDKAANDEANADAPGTAPSRELDLDGNVGDHALGDGTSNPPASPSPLSTRETEIANGDVPPMPASQIAAALEEMEEGSVMESPTAAAARLSSTGLSPAPPPVSHTSARGRLATLEDEANKKPAPASRSSLPHTRIEILNEGMPPMSAIQTAEACEEMEQSIRNSIDEPLPTMPPIPAVQTAAAYEEMEQSIRHSIDEPLPTMPPMPAVQTAAAYKEMEQSIRNSIDEPFAQRPPMPANLAGTILFEDGGDGQTGYENMKTIKDDDSPLQRKRERVRRQQEEILQKVRGPPIRAEDDTQHPSTNTPVRAQSLPAIADQRESSAIPHTRTQSVMLPIRPCPRSMLPSPENNDDASSLPTLQVVEATLYEQESVVYVGTPVEEDVRPWWKKQRMSIVIAVSGLVAGSVVALWAALGFEREPVASSSQPSETQSSLPSLEPSRSSSPSKIPSIHPTFHPSQSVAPSVVRSAPPSTSLVPSTSPSSSPSTPPSESTPPTAFCFEGAINIFTDSHPKETSWTLSRITTEGVANAQVVREGAPEDGSSSNTYEVCLEKGDYEFTIYDSFGDGICCEAGAGHFELVLDGWVVLKGGEFGFSQTASFSLPSASLPPSQSSVPSRSLSPSLRPSTSFGPSSQVPSLGPTSSLGPSPLPSLQPTAPPSTYWSSLVWEQTGQTIIGEAPGDHLGRSVILSGDGMTMAIGSPGGVNNNDRPGYVKVYNREDNASSWQDLGQKIEGTVVGKRFGTGLALSEDGRTLAIGAPGHFLNADTPGYVRVYQMEGDVPGSSWKQLGQDITHEAGTGNLGVSIAMSANGRTLAIGNNVQHDFAGLVRIYGWDDHGTSWKQLGQDLKGEDPDVDDGTFVNLSESFVDLSSDGMTVAIGAPRNNGNGEDSGHVRVYYRELDGLSWAQLGQDINGEAPGDESGFSVSLSADGRTLAIGGIYNDGNGGDSGHARVYRMDDARLIWEQLGQDINGEAAGDKSGFLSLSADGKTVAIGSTANRANGPVSGHVKVYRIEDGANWKQVGEDIDGEPGDSSGSGVSLSADGKTVAIGSSTAGLDWGHVRVFNVNY